MFCVAIRMVALNSDFSIEKSLKDTFYILLYWYINESPLVIAQGRALK